MGFKISRELPITIKNPNSPVTRNCIISTVLLVASLIFLLTDLTEGELLIAPGIVVPSCILLYTFSFYTFIPKAIKKKRPLLRYMLTVFLVLLLAAAPLFLLTHFYVKIDDHAFSFTILNMALQFFIVAPISWEFYKQHNKRNEEVQTLQKELGQSTASLDFLRSQINPHFLFNALNTIYGTAIQEHAERTSEAVQKLGDMMRFMMHENMQEKIALSKEIDYLHNYIDLQRLRTNSNPFFKIETDIEQPIQHISIAPMLLIPFVENAFKHGISLQESSYISVTLKMVKNTLYFHVCNSVHIKHETDPEKDKSGIGLNNVKQRLQLLYANKHELVIRNTGKEFFTHLTITLS
jgi:two-component system, LytTR family, sensor kinase